MCDPVLAVLFGLVAGCAPPPTPARLLAPADQTLATGWHPPPPPTAGLKRYRPVEARSDWGGAPASPSDRTAPNNNQPGMAKPGGMMPGMDMPGMKGMPGMGQ